MAYKYRRRMRRLWRRKRSFNRKRLHLGTSSRRLYKRRR